MASNVGDGRTSRRDSFEDVKAKIKEMVFSLMYFANKQTNGDTNMFFHGIELAIELLQNLAFPIMFAYAQWGPDIDWLKVFLQYIIPYTLMMQSQISFYIVVGILSVMFITGGMIGYTTSRRKLRFVGPLKFLSFAKHLLAGILYIPVVGILVFVAVDCETEYDDIACNSSQFIARSTACFILLVAHFIMSVFIKVTFFEGEPRLKDMTCRPHTRLDALYHIARTILTILTVVLLFFGHGENSDHTTQNWIVALACLAFSGALSFFCLWYLPYYHFKYCQLRAGMLLSFFWASVGLVYSQLRPESDIGLVLVVTLPFMFPLAAFLVASRRRVIERMPIKDINDPFVAELRIRFKLMERGLLFYSTDTEGYTRNNRSPGDLGPSGGNKPKGFMAELDEEVLAQEIAVFNEVNGMLIQFTKQMPKSCFIHIVVGTFQSVYMKNRAQALAVTAKAGSLNPSPPEAFILFKRNKDLNERSIGGTLFDFIAYEKHLQNAKRNEKKAGIAMVQFWSELMKKNPSIHKLESYGSAITTAITVAQQSFIALIKISPNSPNIFRMYGSFVINILDDSKRGQDLLDHAEELEEEAQREGGYTRNNDDEDGDDRMQENVPRATEMDMFSDENGLITISGETNNLCEVLQANAKFLNIFGFKKNELVGVNVTKIIPAPFADPHDAFVARYLETGFAKIIDRPRQILGLHASKHLISVIICVKHVVDAEGKQSFVGIVKPSRQHQYSGFVIMEETFQILHATQNLAEFFGADLMSRKSNLLDVLPGLNPTTATDKTGAKLIWVKTDGKYELEFFGDRLCVAGTTVFIARVKFKRVHEGLGGDLIGNSMQSIGASSIGSEDNAVNPMVFSLHGSASELKACTSGVQSSQQIYNSAYGDTPRMSGCPFVRQPSSGILKGQVPGYASPPPPSFSDNKKLSFMDHSLHNSNAQLKHGTALERRKTNDSDVMLARGDANHRVHHPKSIESDDESSRSYTPSNLPRKKGGGSDKNSVNGGHRANSISGQSSRSSSKNGRNKYENQLKITVARKNAQSNRNLSIVHSLFQIALLIFCGCAVITNVTVNRIYSEISSGLSSIEKHSQLMGNIITLSDSVRTIDMYRAGGYWVRRSLYTPPLNLSKSETLHQASLIAANRTTLFNIHGITVNLSRPAKGKFRTVDSLEAMYTIRTIAKYTASVPFNDRLLRQRLRFVLENAPNTILDLLNTSTTLELQSYNAKVAVQPGEILRMCILGPLTGLLLVLLLFPVHYSINVMRREFLGIFCDIPKEIVKGIYHARMKRMIDNADRSDSEDGEGLEVLGQMHNSQESILDTEAAMPNASGRIPLLTAFKLFMTDKYRLGLRSLFIFAISLGYFVCSGILVQRFIDSNFLAGNSLYWSAQRLAYMKQSSYWTREALVQTVAHVATNLSRVTTYAPPSNFDPLPIPNLLQNLLWVEEGVLYGNSIMNSVPITGLTSLNPQFRLEYQNACIPGSPADCKTYRDALLTRGLHDVFRKYVQEVEMVNGLTKSFNASNLVERAAVDKLLFNLRKLDNEYITPALMESMRLYSQPPADESQWFHSFHLGLTLAFVAILAVFYLVVIRKVVWSIRSELRQTRGLVYMLPADVLLAIPSFKKWSEQGTKPKKLKLEKVGTRDATSPSTGLTKTATKVSINEGP
ncbi:hypothetical protein HDU81_002692 [Chytriomyces hyalinus]|nr:hypothetical protein HDU81_002692 [Chytriomyces hyalinus]